MEFLLEYSLSWFFLCLWCVFHFIFVWLLKFVGLFCFDSSKRSLCALLSWCEFDVELNVVKALIFNGLNWIPWNNIYLMWLFFMISGICLFVFRWKLWNSYIEQLILRKLSKWKKNTQKYNFTRANDVHFNCRHFHPVNWKPLEIQSLSWWYNKWNDYNLSK